MKKGFTLIELLVVVVVIVTLMSITFRIGSAGNESTARNRTVNRMQRLENCLSGYYAAFGSYPPVALHGSRDYYYTTTDEDRGSVRHIQKVQGDQTQESREEGSLKWCRVEAACRSQPISFEYPFKSEKLKTFANKIAELSQKRGGERYEAFDYSRNSQSYKNYSKWQDVQAYRFGVLSYLLPRYLVALGGSSNEMRDINNIKQWTANNALPYKTDGSGRYESWKAVNDAADPDQGDNNRWKIALLPSQSMCTRWLPNLESTLVATRREEQWFCGVQVVDTATEHISMRNFSYMGGGGLSVLDGLTCMDGWGQEFYYCSDPPYQSYRLWSSGPNKRTFPPWVSEEELERIRQEKIDGTLTVQEAIADDVVYLSN